MDKLLGYATIYIVVFLTLCALAWATGNVSEDLYTRCPSGLISNGQQMRVVTGRSRVDCAVRCSLTAGCVGVNVCPVEHDGRVSCALLSNIDPSGCDNLDVDSSGECVFMHSGTTDMETTTTAPLVCQNGGSPAFASNDHCLCPIQYSGTTCERLIRDCGELYDKGYDGAAFSGMYDIQPNGALYPFKVPCQFDSATGVTVVFRRTTTSTSLFNQDWATMKAGINLPISSVDDEFFIGLENLHQFLLQGDYQLNVFINYLGTQGNAFYDNVTVGNESTTVAKMNNLLRHASTVLVIFLSTSAFASTTGDISEDLYTKCPRGLISNGQQMEVVTGQSEVDCAARCSQAAGCVGVNVCQTGQNGQVSCTLLSDTDPSGCGSLGVAVSPGCVFMHNGTTDAGTITAAPLVCQNGGSPAPSQDKCLCPIQYSGTTCERLIRDCSEVYENGYQSAGFNGLYDIEPVGAASPFKVPCQFDSAGGDTVVFRRTTTSTSLFNQNWATMKAGVNLPISSVDDEFFIGLENLHQLLLQGDYQLNVFMIRNDGSDGTASYDNFRIGDEATKYELSYDSFSTGGFNSDNDAANMDKLLGHAVALIAVFLTTSAFASTTGDVSEVLYTKCPRGLISNGQQMRVGTGRSEVDCAVMCSQAAGCVGINVCPTGQDGLNSCSLLSDIDPSGCCSMVVAGSSECVFMHKGATDMDTTVAPPNNTAASPPESTAASPTDSTAASPTDSTAASPPDSTAASPTDSTEAPPPDSTAAPPPDSTAASPTDSTEAPPPDSTAASPTDSTAASPPDSTAASPTDSTAASPPDSTAASPTDSTAASPPDSTAASPTDSTAASPPDSTEAPLPDSTAAPPTDSTAAPPLQCQNGGTPAASNDHCLCPIEYGGTTCERLIRDCQEAFENGYQGSAFNGLYDIQPVGAGSPFKVSCRFDAGAGVTVVFQRSTSSTNLFNQNWATIKAGINVPMSSVDDEFFIGLENLHQLLLQAEYQLKVFIFWGDNAGALYDNFTIGDESTSYQLSYDSFYADVSIEGYDENIENGFPTPSGAIEFYTDDTNSACTSASGGAGWFVPGCTSDGKLFTGIMEWPVEGSPVQMDLAEMILNRASAILP
ncbi:hypothetical protein BaRGS_00003704 [Batillaria attramentaria]|uniref:Uncharacterized protein n=1 Tax=Batillaria attramentaria TaxID=370345 RepID=A0ABD0M1E8_9CAEN